jgi:hypothetical protein
MFPRVYDPKKGCIFTQVDSKYFSETELTFLCKCLSCNPYGGLTSLASLVADAYVPFDGCIYKQFAFEVPRDANLESICLCYECNNIAKFDIVDYYKYVYPGGPVCFKSLFKKNFMISNDGWEEICKQVCNCSSCGKGIDCGR